MQNSHVSASSCTCVCVMGRETAAQKGAYTVRESALRLLRRR